LDSRYPLRNLSCQTQNYLRIVQRYLRMVENFAMLHYSLLQRAPPENHCVLTQPRWPLRSNCCPAVQFDGGADRSLLDSRGARALSGFLSPLGSCARLTSIWGLAGNARIVAKRRRSIRYARADRHPGTHQLRKQLGPLADHNRVREHQGAPRQISLSKLFANSIATFAFISARSARIRRYLWN
jgi:hypothetical protein